MDNCGNNRRIKHLEADRFIFCWNKRVFIPMENNEFSKSKTIDGVPRELLERVREKLSQTDYTWSVGDPEEELRALLDGPAPSAEFKKIEMEHVMNALEDVRGRPVLTSNQCHDLARALNDRLLSPLQLLAMPAEYSAAAQPQGEPVAWQYRIVEDGKPLFNPLKKDGWIDTVEGVAKDMAERPSLSESRHYEVRKLYAEQPAPVDLLRDALDHIARTCHQSRQSTRRIRWIEARANGALEGKPYDASLIELPVKVDREIDRMKRRDSQQVARIRELEGLVRDAQAAFNYDPAGSCYNPGIKFVKPWSERALAVMAAEAEE